jgi:HNH endonuclease
MRIETASGHIILADDEDYELLSQFSWFAQGYKGRFYAWAHVSGSWANRRRTSMHRLLMNPPRHLVVHHKNNNGLDNRRENLEITTQRKNTLYAHEGKPCAHEHKGKWRSQVRGPDGKIVSLGVYETRAEAIAVSDKFKRETRA